MPPKRPPNVEYQSIRELYLAYVEIFLSGRNALIVSPCGHRIYCFEHHFFHMVGILVDGIDMLSMKTEKETILGTEVGFAHYEIREGGARARHLRSAYETFNQPDEVWTENPRVTGAKWVYIKEYDDYDYPFSIGLVGEWEHRSTIPVPFSSFRVQRGGGIKKWRQSKRIYPPETPTATPER